MVGCQSDANVAIACGAPGPQVLDIDNLYDGAEAIATAQAVDPGEVATARGRHLYFAGQQRGTVALGFGELRGVGGLTALAPPSVHPSGKQYVWLSHGRRPLPPEPPTCATDGARAGRARHAAAEARHAAHVPGRARRAGGSGSTTGARREWYPALDAAGVP